MLHNIVSGFQTEAGHLVWQLAELGLKGLLVLAAIVLAIYWLYKGLSALMGEGT